MKRTLVKLVICLSLIMLAVGCGKNEADHRGKSAALPQPSVAERAKQPQRWDLIQKLINQEIFIKVEQPADLPRVFVGRAFYSLTFDQKAQFINVVYAYYKTENPRANTVIIKDGYTGKQIGKYAEVYGGLKMN